MPSLFPRYYPNGRRRFNYVNEDGSWNKTELRAEIDRCVHRDWTFMGIDSRQAWWNNARSLLILARQNRDAVLRNHP